MNGEIIASHGPRELFSVERSSMSWLLKEESEKEADAYWRA